MNLISYLKMKINTSSIIALLNIKITLRDFLKTILNKKN